MTDRVPQILVVDDLPDWQTTIRGLLRDEKYDVQVADSSSRAIELLERNQFDLAVLDMRLDETDEDNTEGLDLAETIQQRWPMVKVIILTGYNTPERQARAMAPNAQGQSLVADFIEKRESETLVQSVQRLLNQ
jgi:CheY-like chemotaxis protein